MELEK